MNYCVLLNSDFNVVGLIFLESLKSKLYIKGLLVFIPIGDIILDFIALELSFLSSILLLNLIFDLVLVLIKISGYVKLSSKQSFTVSPS